MTAYGVGNTINNVCSESCAVVLVFPFNKYQPLFVDPIGFSAGQPVVVNSAIGATTGTQQTILATVSAVGGTTSLATTIDGVFQVNFNSVPTGNIVFQQSLSTTQLALNVQNALNALSTIIPGRVTVSCTAGPSNAFYEFTVSFFGVPAAASNVVTVTGVQLGGAVTFATGYTADKTFSLVFTQDGGSTAPSGTFTVTLTTGLGLATALTTAAISYSSSATTLAGNIQAALNDATTGLGSVAVTTGHGNAGYKASVSTVTYSAASLGGYVAASTQYSDVLVVFVTTTGLTGMSTSSTTAPAVASLVTLTPTLSHVTAAVAGPTAQIVNFFGASSGSFKVNAGSVPNWQSLAWSASPITTFANSFVGKINSAAGGSAIVLTSAVAVQTTATATTTAGANVLVQYVGAKAFINSNLAVDLQGFSQSVWLAGPQGAGVIAKTTSLQSQWDNTNTLGVTTVFTPPSTGFNNYDVVFDITCLTDLCDIARLKINSEIVGLINAAHTGPLPRVFLEGVLSDAQLLHAFAPIARTRAYISTVATSTAVHDEFVFGLPKAPWVYTNLVDSFSLANPAPDAGLTWWYFQDVAIEAPLNLVLQVTSVTTNPDQFTWKIAGDTWWQAPRDITTGADICLAASLTGTTPQACESSAAPGSPSLAALLTYLTATQNYTTTSYSQTTTVATNKVSTSVGKFVSPDDVNHRQINYLRYAFAVAELDSRTACTTMTNQKNYYYFQFGSNGVNDAPECSDRGLCDYTSGVCKCFKGYAGIDCTAQSALSAGSSGGGSATVASASSA